MNHNRGRHAEEWKSYKTLVDKDAITNYFKPITTASMAIEDACTENSVSS